MVLKGPKASAIRRGNSAEGGPFATPNKKQIDVVETGNCDAQCLAARMELGLAESIAALRRATNEENPERTLFHYADGTGVSDLDLEAFEELWADLIAAFNTKKTLPVFRESFLLLDSHKANELTNADNQIWRYAWAKSHASVFTKMWQHVRRRCIPQKGADG